MVSFPARDLRAALDFASRAAAVRDTEDVADALLPALCELLDCPGAILHEVDLDTGAQFDLFWPRALADPDVVAAYAAVMRSHPFIRVASMGEPVVGVRISDLMSRRAWRSTDVYGTALKQLWAEDQMTTTLARRGTTAEGVSVVTDGRAFTERQRQLLLLVRPHVAAAQRRTHRSGATHRVMAVGDPATWVDRPCTTEDARTGTGPASLLTPAERRVLDVAATGLTSAQVARRLGASPRTVEKHLEHAYDKLGVTNRVAALQVVGVPRQLGSPVEPTSLPGCSLAV